MPPNPTKRAFDVLHIRPGPGGPAPCEDMDGRLADASLVVESCEDVYAGLARLCRGDRPAPGALIVCVDGLGAPEMEFFSLASQWRSAPKTYVYGDAHAASRLNEAVRLGATGLCTDALICALGAKADERGHDSSERLAGSDSFVPEHGLTKSGLPTDDGPAQADVEHSSPPQPEANPPDARDEPAGSVRVPWQHYDEDPARQRPKTRPKPPQGEPRIPDRGAAPDPHEPLLTPAELEALLGDDISAIVPNRPEGTGPGGGKGIPL